MGSSPSVIARASDPSASGFKFNEGIVVALGNVQVLAASTWMPTFFKDLWDQEQGMAAVALLRHFGCICCWELASELKELIPRLEAAGVKLIVVGVGGPENARILAEQAYNVLGLYHGLRRTFFSRAINLSRCQKLQWLFQDIANPYPGRGFLDD